MDDLAKRAVACKRWRWMPGMLVDLGSRSMRLDARSIEDLKDGENPIYPWQIYGPVIPDLTDPATLGCLLAMVREAWGSPFAQVSPGLGRIGVASSVVDAGFWVTYPNRDLDDRSGFRGNTEAEALIAALEAAPEK